MKKYIFLLLLPLLFSCSEEAEPVYMKCGTVEYVDEFPKTLDIKEADLKQLNIDLSGCVDFFLADNLLICKFTEQDYFWHVYSLKDLSMVGKLLRKGHGRHETMFVPGSEFVNISDSAVTCDFLSDENDFLRCNLTKSIATGQLCVDEINTGAKLDDASYISALKDSAYFVINYNGLGRRREILKGGHAKEIGNIGNLNKVQVSEDANTIAFVTYVNKQKGMVAEAMLCLNQINLYSLLDSAHQNKTICLGKELMNVSKIDNMSRRKRKWTLSKVKSYSDYFAVLYQNATERELYDSDRESFLLVFKWDGTPVLKIRIPFMASSFGISDTGDIYIFDNYGKYEKLYLYKNINDIV